MQSVWLNFYLLSLCMPLYLYSAVSEKAVEARLSLENSLEIDITKKQLNFNRSIKPGVEFLSSDKTLITIIDVDGDEIEINRRDFVRERIIDQVDYLYGAFQSYGFLYDMNLDDESGFGTLGERAYVYDIVVEKFRHYSTIIKYKYSIKALINRRVFEDLDDSYILFKPAGKKGKEVRVNVLLPTILDEQKIYTKKCTDKHYYTFDDYWYFFNAYDPKCWEKINSDQFTDYFREVEVTIKREPFAHNNTYPEYRRLYDKEVLRIDTFIGLEHGDLTMKELEDLGFKMRKPDDVGYADYYDLLKILKTKEKFKVKSANSAFSFGYRTGGNDLYLKNPSAKNPIDKYGHYEGINYYHVMEKNVRRKNSKVKKIVVNLMFIDTSIGSNDLTFWVLWKDAIEKADLISYGGHSGLGGNLDIYKLNLRLGEIGLEEIEFNDSYQIIHFNGCSTYGYYNRKYFKKKSGIKNLEIITTGLQSAYGDTYKNFLAFARPFYNFKYSSYKKIVKSIESSNEISVLSMILGDEDNPLEAR